MPCPKLACPCHGLACHVKIVSAVSERVMIDPCECRSVSIRVHVDPCQSVSNPGVAIFAEKSPCGNMKDLASGPDLADFGPTNGCDIPGPAQQVAKRKLPEIHDAI